MDRKINKLYEKINNNKDIIVFGLLNCMYCKKTIEILKKNNINFRYYPIDKYFKLFFKILQKLNELYPNLNINTSHKTVPVIFYKKKFVGGYNEISKIIIR